MKAQISAIQFLGMAFFTLITCMKLCFTFLDLQKAPRSINFMSDVKRSFSLPIPATNLYVEFFRKRGLLQEIENDHTFVMFSRL